jgi:NADPH:quinone reductase-like Zn-dependent oxidoreductase
MKIGEVSRTSGVSARSLRHYEAVGEIVGVGPDVDSPLRLRAHVVGSGPGAFAQYMTMPAAGVLPVPSGWSDAEALGLVLDWATALAALKPLGEIKTGEVVHVHAAAGGAGQAAVRLARHYGARMIATASPAKHDTVRALGADEVLDSRRPDPAEEIIRLTGGVDLVLESVGHATFEVSLSVTKPFTGGVVVFGAASGDATLTTHDPASPTRSRSRVCTSVRRRPQPRRSTSRCSSRSWRSSPMACTRPAPLASILCPRGRQCCGNSKRAGPVASSPSIPGSGGRPRSRGIV